MRQVTGTPQILVIEDDLDAAMLLTDVLVEHFESECVTVAETVAAALDLDLTRFHLVLSDYNLPDGSGLDALKALLNLRPDLPVIMVTGESEISIAVEAIRHGAYDYVVKSPTVLSTIPLTVEKNLELWRVKQENARLQVQLERSLDRIKESNSQLSAMVAKLEEMALTDALTSLSNRRHLNRSLIQMFAEASRYQSELSCVMMDLDGFKSLNDTLGHQRGDELLSRVGRLITTTCRESDFAARYGGDEFIILLPKTDRDTAVNLVMRLREEFARMRESSYADHPELNMSFGIACTRISHPDTGEQLVQHADNALYKAKEAGKARVMLCQEDGETAVAVGEPDPSTPPAAGVANDAEPKPKKSKTSVAA
ncbi:MAG: diguanylate cyclase [Phycisphaerales bacterium]